MPETPDSGPRRVVSVLEAVRPHPGSFDPAGMARGEPGLPKRFDWRGRTYEVAEVLSTAREVENASGLENDAYVRRHAFRLRTTTGEVMTLAAVRGTGRGGPRWTLRSLEEPSS